MYALVNGKSIHIHDTKGPKDICQVNRKIYIHAHTERVLATNNLLLITFNSCAPWFQHPRTPIVSRHLYWVLCRIKDIAKASQIISRKRTVTSPTNATRLYQEIKCTFLDTGLESITNISNCTCIQYYNVSWTFHTLQCPKVTAWLTSTQGTVTVVACCYQFEGLSQGIPRCWGVLANLMYHALYAWRTSTCSE